MADDDFDIETARPVSGDFDPSSSISISAPIDDFDIESASPIDPGMQPPRQHTFRESTGTTVDAPYGMTPSDIEYHDDMQNIGILGKIKGSFVASSVNTVLNSLETKQIFTPLDNAEIERYYELSRRPEIQRDYSADGILGAIATATSSSLPQFYEQGKGAIVGGSSGGGVGLLFGAPLTGAGMGATLGSAYKSFEQQTGQISRDLKQVRGASGEKLDPDVIKGASVAAGVINGGLDLVPFGAVVRHIPGMDAIAGELIKPLKKTLEGIPGFDKIAQPFTKEGMREVLKLPGAQKVFYNFGKRITEVTAAEGVTGGLQQGVQIAATEASKAASEGEFKPITFGEAIVQIGQSAAQEAAGGVGLGGTVAAASIPGDIKLQREMQGMPTPDGSAQETGGTEPQKSADADAQAPETMVAPSEEQSPVAENSSIPDSVLSAFPDMVETNEGAISMNSFSEEERQALTNAGLVQEYTTAEGNTYQGVSAEALWQARDARRSASNKETQAAKSAEPSPEQMVSEAFMSREEAKENVATEEEIVTEKTSRTADEKLLQGRLNHLDQQVDTLDSQIDALAALVEERQAQGKTTKRLENKIERLLKQREPLDEERANILNASDRVVAVSPSGNTVTDRDFVANEASQGDVTLKGKRLQSDARARNRARLRALQRGLREGARIAKTDAKAAQEAIIALIDQSDLPNSEKGKFIAALKNIQTSEQAAAAIPRLSARISSLVSKLHKQELRAAIKKILKTTKVRKQSGKPVGKFANADLQRTFDILRAASKMSKGAAQEKLLSNLENSEPTIDTALENQVLAIMADIDAVPSEQIESVLNMLKSMVEEGRSSAKEKMEARRSRISEIKDSIVGTLLKGRAVEDISQIDWRDRLSKALNSARAMESGMNNAWFDTLDILLGTSEAGREVRDSLKDSVFKAIQKEAGLSIDLGNAFVKLAKDVFGITKTRALRKKFIADEKIEYLGDFARDGQVEEGTLDDSDPVGAREPKAPVRWELSRAQARKLWMELQDPTVRETLIDPDGNGITVEMEETLDDFLTPEDKEFAKAQLRFYKEIYPKINEVYAAIYGVHLPDNPFYSPIKRRHKEKIGSVTEFLQDLKNRMSVAPGFAKLRKRTNAIILPQSDITAMLQHIAQASHFISMAETARDLQSIFSDPSVRESIDATWGDGMKENIDGYIMDFTSGSIQRAEGWMKLLDTLNSNYAKAVLGAKLNMIPKQMSSMFAYASQIPIVHYMAGLADFAKNPREAIRILSQSDLMRKRGSSQDVDIAKGAQQQAKKMLGARSAIDEFLLSPIKAGDRAAIYTGGWAVYKYNRDVLGKTHEQALKAFEEATDDMQQSSNLNQLSRMQASKNPFMRTLGMFMSAPNAYYRAEKRAIRQAFRGEIGIAEAAKKVAILHLVLPTIFQFVANGFYWDDEDQKRAAGLGSLNGFLVLGSILETAVSSIFDAKRRGKGQSIIFAEGMQEFFAAMTQAAEEGVTWEEILEGLDAVGKITGLPVETVRTEISSVKDIQEGYTDVGIKKIAGYTEKTASKPYR